MTDWENLRDALHGRELRLIIDLAVNHTSDEHEWFPRSRRGQEPSDEYYIWEQRTPEEPPNNWGSLFGIPAWSYDDQREAWYFHLFDERMPDLNWQNSEVRQKIETMMRWWLEKGMTGSG